MKVKYTADCPGMPEEAEIAGRRYVRGETYTISKSDFDEQRLAKRGFQEIKEASPKSEAKPKEK